MGYERSCSVSRGQNIAFPFSSCSRFWESKRYCANCRAETLDKFPSGIHAADLVRKDESVSAMSPQYVVQLEGRDSGKVTI